MTRSEAIPQPPPSPELHEAHDGPPPSPWLMAMEFRAFWEFGAIVPFWPLLQRAPMGDGHPVIVFPGLSASDGSTVPLRGYLSSRNYTTASGDTPASTAYTACITGGVSFAETLSLDGTETFDVTGLDGEVKPRQDVKLVIHRASGSTEEVPVTLRIDTPIEIDYYQHGGILPYVLRQLIAQGA